MMSWLIGKPGAERESFWRGFRPAFIKTNLWLSPAWLYLVWKVATS